MRYARSVRYEDLPTEGANPRSRGLDTLGTREILEVMNEEDRRAPVAVAAALPDVARAADLAADALRAGGRLIYAGAGTSGRLGVLDAAECPPTFGTGPDRVVGLIAGGPESMFRAREGAEDDAGGGARDVLALEPGPADLVVGIAASGATPYVRGALEAARGAGARTALVTCGEPPDDAADVVIRLDTGPEVLAGSTRLKAGTATKLVLNMISTAAMVRIGKVYDNLMVDLRAGSAKLRDRSVRIVSQLADLPPDRAREALDAAEGEVKTTVAAARLGVSPGEARRRIEKAGGHLRIALEEAP